MGVYNLFDPANLALQQRGCFWNWMRCRGDYWIACIQKWRNDVLLRWVVTGNALFSVGGWPNWFVGWKAVIDADIYIHFRWLKQIWIWTDFKATCWLDVEVVQTPCRFWEMRRFAVLFQLFCWTAPESEMRSRVSLLSRKRPRDHCSKWMMR